MSLPINSASLVNELRATLTRIDQQIEAITADVDRQIRDLPYADGVTVYQWKNRDGSPVLADMLSAKATCLAAIAQLQAAQVRAR